MAALVHIVQQALTAFERDALRYRQHPLKLLYVPPHDIERLCALHLETRARLGSKFFDLGRIEEGDWDLPAHNPLLQTSSTDRSVHAHYMEGVAWSKTAAFRIKLRRIDEGRIVDGCRSRADLLKRYERLDRVAQDMARNGFRIMRNPKGEVDFSQILSVSLTRQGEALLGTGGKHRLAIAKLLKLPSIPVLVFLRHNLWQQTLEAYFKGVHPAQKQLSSHPDLQENLEAPGVEETLSQRDKQPTGRRSLLVVAQEAAVR